jgi:hypothetical protein
VEVMERGRKKGGRGRGSHREEGEKVVGGHGGCIRGGGIRAFGKELVEVDGELERWVEGSEGAEEEGVGVGVLGTYGGKN